MVYCALDPADGTVVAIKVLRTEQSRNPDVLKRLRKEARLMAEANSPFVVNLLEYNEDGGIPYLVLEFVAGQSLGDLLAKQDPARSNDGHFHHGGGGTRPDGGP